jgi:hypothetical protein
VWIRDELLAVNGPDAVRDMGRAYGLERIEQLEQDLPVSVYLYEVSDAVPGDQMRGLPIHERYTLDTVGRLTNVLAIPGRFVARSDASET